MNVLFISAEVDPFAKVGGLADVVGSLPKALRRLGIDARVIMPAYRMINHDRYGIKTLFTFPVVRRTETVEATLYETVYDDVPIYFIGAQPYFGSEETVYTDHDTDVPRFLFFNQAVIAAADALDQWLGWFPNVMHVHDWHTGLIPFLVQLRRMGGQKWSRVRTMLTLHNMAYQGDHVGGWLYEQGIPTRDRHDELRERGLTDNMLAIGIAYSEVITTVSPRYATEIQYPYAGFGLDGLLKTRLDDLRGILNGLDMDEWNPATDRHLPARFFSEQFEDGRDFNKMRLQQESGLEPRPDVPLIGLVSRLVWQKGIDLLVPAMETILETREVQFVALGSGEPLYNQQLAALESEFPDKARINIGYNAAVAQHIYGGCDIFLMPSRYEPCGVGQMIAMRYGALPLVRETGGLADTVENFDNEEGERGTGFVFQWEEVDALTLTLGWALDTYTMRREAFRRMQVRAMQTDFSWNKSAQEYIDLYQSILNRRL